MAAYYNENDPFAAQWLRELIQAGLILTPKMAIEDTEAYRQLMRERASRAMSQR
jgi:hypothetical protein